MPSTLTVRFWGVRGSLAVGGPQFGGIGANTTCVEVRAGNELIILDAGTGVFPLGQSLQAPVRATFLFTHFHWDHIQGLPFFAPAYAPGNTFTLCGPGEDAAHVRRVFARQMRAPHFPVPLAALKASLEFRALRPGDQLEIGPAHIRTARLNHPQGCLGYRISVGSSSVVFATDTEPCDSDPWDFGALELARGTDLLIHDCQYTEDEYRGWNGPPRKGWGHSTVEVACRLARAADVGQLALFHHDPSHDALFVERMAARARALFPNSVLAREGMMVNVARGSVRDIAAVGSRMKRPARRAA